jgi:uncharacterized membrane protein SpoIIM required for sporulation
MNLLRTVKAVLWAFFGIRGKNEYEQDLGRLKPLHIITVALVLVAVFVATLIGVVNWVVKN